MQKVKFFILFIFTLGCGSKNDNSNFLNETRKDELSIKDSLILGYVIENYSLRPGDPENIKEELLEDDLFYKETVLYPSGHKFRLYKFMSAMGEPYVISVSDSIGNLIDLFSLRYFGSRKYYVNLFDERLTIEANPNFKGEMPMNKFDEDLNRLVIKLGYQNDFGKILSLLEVIFQDLLKMPLIDIRQWNSSLKYLDEFKTNNSEILESFKEYRDISNYLVSCNFCMCYQADGLFGYWIIEFVVNEETIKLKTRFVSSLLYIGPIIM